MVIDAGLGPSPPKASSQPGKAVQKKSIHQMQSISGQGHKAFALTIGQHPIVNQALGDGVKSAHRILLDKAKPEIPVFYAAH